jgi:hypothetical protein
MGSFIIVAVVAFIAGAIGSHMYQSRNVRKPGTGRSETTEDVKDDPKEKTFRN